MIPAFEDQVTQRWIEGPREIGHHELSNRERSSLRVGICSLTVLTFTFVDFSNIFVWPFLYFEKFEKELRNWNQVWKFNCRLS